MALPPDSLDAVLTDPPYFANVQYAELMDFCYVWLRKHLAGDFPAFRFPSTRTEEELTDYAGEVVPYNDGMQVKPDYLSPPQMPGWWIQQPAMVKEELDDIMGVHDISRGAAPANIESGFGLTILAEKDNTPINRFIKLLHCLSL